MTDFADNFNEHLKGHALMRLAIIKNTAGFDRYSLENGKDFDFVKVGVAKRLEAA